MPQPIHTVSNISDTPQGISLISDASISDPLGSQFSSPTPSQITSNPFIPPQGPISNIERLLSQAHWNHSFNIINSSPSFQSPLHLSFQGSTPVITLSSNSPTADHNQHSHHCIGKQPDTTRTYPTLLLKLDPKFVVPPPPFFGDHNTSEQLHNWAKQRTSKSYKITTVQEQREHDLVKQSKITFSVEIVVDQDKFFSPKSCSTSYFRVKTIPSPFIYQEIHYKLDRYTKNAAGNFVCYNPHSGLSHISN